MSADPFVHPALFYQDRVAYLAGTIPFVRAGLDAGGSVAVAVPMANLAAIRDALGERADEVHLVDMCEAGRNPGRIIHDVLQAFIHAHAGRPVSIIGEPIWPGRTAAEYPACAQHEALINMAFTGHAVSILCPYDVAELDQTVVDDARRTHRTVIDADGAHASPAYAPVSVLTQYNQALPAPPESAVASFLFSRHTRLQACSYAITMARRLGLPAYRTDHLAAAVTELTANSVSHGGGRGTLQLWSAEGYIVCRIHDAGTMTDPLVGRRPDRPDAPGGRGLRRVHRVADLVRIHTVPGRTTVCAYFER